MLFSLKCGQENGKQIMVQKCSHQGNIETHTHNINKNKEQSTEFHKRISQVKGSLFSYSLPHCCGVGS